MKIKYPDAERCVGEHRDHKIEREVQVFEHGEFVLNRALEGTKAQVNKVKTFDRHAGDHNVIAHSPEPSPKPHPRLRPELSPQALRTLMHAGVPEEKKYAQDRMQASPGMLEKFSEQPKEKFHKHKVELVRPKLPTGEIHGFRGLGDTSGDSPRGRQRVVYHPYDPLRLRAFATGGWQQDRPQGLRVVGPPATETIQEHFQYDDGAKLEDLMKPVIRHPHIHQFEKNFSPEEDIPGFSGLGQADIRPKVTGKKYLEAEDHFYPPRQPGSYTPQLGGSLGGNSEQRRQPPHHLTPIRPNSIPLTGPSPLVQLTPAGQHLVYDRNVSHIQFAQHPGKRFT